jgi:hypothetical protein
MPTTQRLGSGLLVGLCGAAFVAVVGVGVGCSNNNNNSGSAGSFFGMYTDPSAIPGTITLNEVSAAIVSEPFGSSASTPVTGTLTFPGALAIHLTGSYFTGTGDAYSFTGQVTGGTGLGTSTGPNGAGSFVLFLGGTSATVAVFCGSGVCDPVACKTTSAFNLAVSGGGALMTALVNGTTAAGRGTHTGDLVSFHISDATTDVTIGGTINGLSVGGTWSDNNAGVSGDWSGNTSNCSAVRFR